MAREPAGKRFATGISTIDPLILRWNDVVSGISHDLFDDPEISGQSVTMDGYEAESNAYTPEQRLCALARLFAQGILRRKMSASSARSLSDLALKTSGDSLAEGLDPRDKTVLSVRSG